MPEGHTVHRLARTFSDLFLGEAVLVSSPQGRFADGAALISGNTLVRSEAYGKQMFLGFGAPDCADEGLQWLRVHLGLYGSWTFSGDSSVRVAHAIGAPRKRIGEQEKVLSNYSDASTGATDGGQRASGGNSSPESVWNVPEPRGQVRVRIVGEHAVADLTGPTACEVISWREAQVHINKLGPDPIRLDANPAAFVEKVQKSRIAIGQQLMNQSVIAGVGNIYRAEALFRANLDPYAAGASVPRETLLSVWDDLVVLMEDGVRTGAIVTTAEQDRDKGIDPVALAESKAVTRQNTDGLDGSVPREESFYVYHRAGQPCRVCGTPISLAEMQARKLYWCPSCQA